MDMFLKDKVAIVTGAGAGIGRASALALAAEGAHVMVTDIDPSVAERTAAEIRSAGGSAASHRVDIGNESDIVAAIAATVKTFGGLHIMHNNAADTSADTLGRDGNVQTLDPTIWDKTMHINLKGTMLCIRHGIPELLRAKGGSIINTSSITSFMGMDFYTAYTASKAAINQLTRNVAVQYGRHNIRCNSVAPGIVMTDTQRRQTKPEEFEIIQADAVSPRLGAPEDMANAVVFLASERSHQITGQTLHVDGGIRVHAPRHGGGVSLEKI